MLIIKGFAKGHRSISPSNCQFQGQILPYKDATLKFTSEGRIIVMLLNFKRVSLCF